MTKKCIVLDGTNFKFEPSHKALAMLCSKVSNVIVLDIDNIDEWTAFCKTKKLESEYDTVTQISQSGGMHYFFRWDERFSSISTTRSMFYLVLTSAVKEEWFW